MRVIDDLDGACKAARERLHRSIGQRVRYAKEALRKQAALAGQRINEPTYGSRYGRPETFPAVRGGVALRRSGSLPS